MSCRLSSAKAGFALPAAIFLMVILAALGAFLVQVSSHQQAGQIADIQGLRAYQAARAGIEWGAFNFLRNTDVNTNCVAANFNPGGGLAAFTVSVTCAKTDNGDGNADPAVPNVHSALVTATACNQPTAARVCPPPVPAAGYVERQISVVIAQ